MTNSPAKPSKRAVLVGAGHAHLYTLKRSAEFAQCGYELTLVAPDSFWYSGLATGMLGGIYDPQLDQVDVAGLVTRGGGRFLRDRVTAIVPTARMVYLQHAPPITYDVLSLNLGSEVPLSSIPGAAEHGYAVKPIRNLWNLRQELEERFQTSNGNEPVQIVVTGGGTTACEIAANILRLARDRRDSVATTILAASEELLPGLPRRAAKRVLQRLRRAGVSIRLETRVQHVAKTEVVTSTDESVPYDVLVHAVGLAPHRLVSELGLPTAKDGSLLVNEHLASIADPHVFGGGDCVALEDRNLAKIGVFAVRQAPVLFHNLLATLSGAPLATYQPQSRYLLIMNLGDGTGLATWGRFYWHGRVAFRWKDWLDRRFLAEYRA